MKWVHWLVILFGIIIISVVTIGYLDVTYQSVKKSYDNISVKDKKAPLVSPNISQFNASVSNHWRISPVFSGLEDVFYPVRKWAQHPMEAIQSSNNSEFQKLQLSSMVRIEKATKVRALRAYFSQNEKILKTKH